MIFSSFVAIVKSPTRLVLAGLATSNAGYGPQWGLAHLDSGAEVSGGNPLLGIVLRSHF